MSKHTTVLHIRVADEDLSRASELIPHVLGPYERPHRSVVIQKAIRLGLKSLERKARKAQESAA